MEIKFKDNLCKLLVENVNIEFQINEDLSFTLVSSDKKFHSPGEYEFDGLHAELLTVKGMDFKKIYIANILTKNNSNVCFVSLVNRLEKDNIAILSNSDIIIAKTEFVVNNENSFGKLNPFYVVAFGENAHEKYIKLFSVGPSEISSTTKIDEKKLIPDSDYITKYILIK